MDKKKTDIIDKACRDTLKKYPIEQTAMALYSYITQENGDYFTSMDNRDNIEGLDPSEVMAFVVENILVDYAYRANSGDPTQLVQTSKYGTVEVKEVKDMSKTPLQVMDNMWHSYTDGGIERVNGYLTLDMKNANTRPELALLFNASLYFLNQRYVKGMDKNIDLYSQTAAGNQIVNDVEAFYSKSAEIQKGYNN